MSEKSGAQQSRSELIAEKASAARELVADASSKLNSIFSPDNYLCFLNLVERFHWYSYINIFLIFLQHPDAEAVAGYDLWKRTSLATYNDPSRRILKASGVGQGIKLIAPFTVVEGATRSLINVSVPVYDINQTNDIPAPQIDFLDLNKVSHTDIINAINFVAPYRTVFASNEDKNLSYNVKGYCNHRYQQMVVDSRLTIRGLLTILFHEFAVSAVYLSGYKDESLLGLVEESIFYILLKHFRLQVEDITFSYIGRFKNLSPSQIGPALYVIQTVSHSIIEKTEEHLEYIAELIPAHEEFSYQASFFDNLDFLQGSMSE